MLSLKKSQDQSPLKTKTAQLPSNQNIPLLNPSKHFEFSLQSPPVMPKSGRFIEQWTREQQKTLYSNYQKYGPKWVSISKLINKSDTAVKNKFFGRIRKLGRKLSYIGKSILKPKNPIHQKMIFRVIEAPRLISQPFEGYNELKETIKKSLFSLAQLEQIQIEESKNLIEQIHKFNSLSRTYNLKNLWKKEVRQSIQQQCKVQEKEEPALSKLLISNQSDGKLLMMNNEQIEEIYNARLGTELTKYSFCNLLASHQSDGEASIV